MGRWALGACGFLTAWAAAAADGPAMTLWVDATAVEQPEAFRQVSDSLVRYPSCFDAVAFGGKPGDPRVEELVKLGVPASSAEVGSLSSGFVLDDHDPRALIGGALLFASGEIVDRAMIGNGGACASGKTAHGVCVESMLDLAYGAGALDYALVGGHEPAAWYANTFLSELALWRPFFQAYVRYNAGTKPGGFLPYCGKGAKPSLAGTLRAAAALAPAGFPVCPGSPWPVCYLLSADSVKSMTAVDVQRALSGGAVLDGGAVAELLARGYGASLQMDAARRDAAVTEQFTDDELNRGRVNYVWRPHAAQGEVFALFPSNEAARVLGRYRRADGQSAEAASVLFETPAGGRIAVFGFAGFGGELSEARRRQVMLAADWVAQNRLPVMVEAPAQVVVVPRVLMAGDLRSVTVLNAAIDVQPPVTLRLRGLPAGLARMEWLVPKEKPVAVAIRWEEKDALVVLPAIGPWQVGWLRPSDLD